LAGALAELAVAAGCSAVVDIGAGRGELLTALAAHPATTAGRLRLHGVDVVERPESLPDVVGWSAGLPEVASRRQEVLDGALLIAWELLDVVPCTVLEVDADRVPRVVLVEPGTGREDLAGGPEPPEADWCRRWWPWQDAEAGDRIEVGLSRDELWGELVRWLAATQRGGLALAVDYAHYDGERPPGGTLTGFHRGRARPPVPDGSGDVTAHVALDSVARVGGAVVERVRRDTPDTTPVLSTQAEALRRLGLGGAAVRDPHAPAPSGAGLLAGLRTRSQEAELLDPGGLGGFGWLMQPAGLPIPEVFD
jgi:SAM-dependent MidA family methyltransferase